MARNYATFDEHPRFRAIAVKLAGYGVANAKIAVWLGISVDTLERELVRNSNFRKKFESAKPKTIVNSLASLIEQVEAGNTTAIIYYLDHIANLKNTQEIAVEHRGEVVLTLSEIVRGVRATQPVEEYDGPDGTESDPWVHDHDDGTDELPPDK